MYYNLSVVWNGFKFNLSGAIDRVKSSCVIAYNPYKLSKRNAQCNSPYHVLAGLALDFDQFFIVV